MMKFRILTTEKILFPTNVLSVTLPIDTGIMQILPGHAPLLQEVVEGHVLLIEESKKECHLSVQKGLCLISPTWVTLLTSYAMAVSFEKPLAEALKEMRQDI